MVTLTKRQKDILKYLVEQRDHITISQISKFFQTSDRTVRNEFAYIDAYLECIDLKMNRKTNRGVRLCCNEEEQMQILNALGKSDLNIFNKEERLCIELILLLVCEKNTFKKIAEVCQVSKQTVFTDFYELEKKLASIKIGIVKQKGIGIKIESGELKIRKLFEKVIKKIGDDSTITNILIKYSGIKSFEQETLRLLERVERHLGIEYVNSSMIQYIIQFAFKRTSEHNYISDDEIENEYTAIKKYKEYDDFYNVIDNPILMKNDKLYLCNILINSQMVLSHNKLFEPKEKSDKEANEIANYLIEQLEKIQSLDKETKKYFVRGLALHLDAAIYRTRNSIKVENELLEQIKISIPLIFQFTKNELHKCEGKFSIKFGEKEIAYIAMYIASAFENTVKVVKTISVLLICSFGVATSSILKTRIHQVTADCNIIGPLSKMEATKYLANHKADLIITTNDYTAENTQVIKVNPLLYAEDVDYIKSRLFQMSYSIMCQSFINSYRNYDLDNVECIYIKDYVERDNIQIVSECVSWQEAIKLAANPLLVKRLLQERYVNKMIEAVKQFGTYMVLVKDTAFIHAGTEDGINDDCTAILILNKPILLGDKNPKIVRNFVVLGIKNKTENSLLKLVYVFENEKNLEKLKNRNISISDICNMHN